MISQAKSHFNYIVSPNNQNGYVLALISGVLRRGTSVVKGFVVVILHPRALGVIAA